MMPKFLEGLTLVNGVAFVTAENISAFLPDFLGLGDGQVLFADPREAVG